MKKFNGFESHLLEQGLSMVMDSMKKYLKDEHERESYYNALYKLRSHVNHDNQKKYEERLKQFIIEDFEMWTDYWIGNKLPKFLDPSRTIIGSELDLWKKQQEKINLQRLFDRRESGEYNKNPKANVVIDKALRKLELNDWR